METPLGGAWADGAPLTGEGPFRRTVGECLTLGGHVYPNGRAFGDGKCVYCGREQSPPLPKR